MMNKIKPTVKEVLTRGVSDVLPSEETLAKLMSERKIRVYLGIDPTGSLLTLGHAVVLRKLQQFADLGHEVILLIGNGTVRIGDPTGRDKTRPVLTDKQIEENFKNWKTQASKILDFDKIIVKHNGDWLDKLTFTYLVKLLAQTTVQQLTERDMFQTRMKKGLPIHGHEIIYPLLQGFDSVAMDVDLEIGGGDQTFNMLMGRHLQKVYNNHEKWILTTPIINGTNGQKMSKSLGNFIALTENPKDMFGKLMSIPDNQIVEYFTLLTNIPIKHINKIALSIQKGENPIKFKKQLAFIITESLHSTKLAKQVQQAFTESVQGNKLPENIPVVSINEKSINIIKAVKLCLPNESNREIKRLVNQGAIELVPQEKKVKDAEEKIKINKSQVIKVGKLKYFELVVSG